MSRNTKELILKQATLLFNEYGYDGVTMRQIAQQVDISVGNLTYYFKKKEDIVVAIVDSIKQEQDKTPIHDLNDFYNALYEYILSTIEKKFFFAKTSLITCQDEFYQKNIENIRFLNTRLTQGLIYLRDNGILFHTLSDTTLHSLINFYMLSHMAWIHEGYRNPLSVQYNINTFIQMHFDVLKGFLTDEGLKQYEQLKDKFIID